MVLLHHHHQVSSRKRPSSASIPSSSPPKIPRRPTNSTASISNATATATATAAEASSGDIQGHTSGVQPEAVIMEKMVSVLADAGCTLINPAGPPCLPSDPHKFRGRLHRLFSSSVNAPLRSQFLSAFSFYIQSPHNFRRVLVSCNRGGSSYGSSFCDSLMRHLLLVPSIQLDLQIMLLEKLPEYFDVVPECDKTAAILENDISRLILSQFRWLDFLVDSNSFTEKLLQVLSICPLNLKKEIIGSLPEIIGDKNDRAVVDYLEKILREDSNVIVPVLDSLSNLNLDDQLQEQVITIALSCIGIIDEDQMPYLLRFLLLSATPVNARRIISRIREQVKFVSVSSSDAMHQNKLKGKSPLDNSEASILDSLRSGLQFKNKLCEEILKELKSLEKPQDHKVIDIWLLMLIYMNGKSLQKNVEKILKKKIIEGFIQEGLFDQCIRGSKALVQDYFPLFLSLSEYLLACKETKAREFGIHMYTCLFEGFVDTYSRQEVLGALVAHVGSGISFEVGSALDTMILLASKLSQEMVPLSSHINGILDYLEGFSIENLHKVYDVFGHLALWAKSTADSFGSSFANELFMIVRKQISNPDMKYKKMGLIGTLKIVSCLEDAGNVACPSSFQKLNSDEALELLKMVLESCKQLPLLLILFYDELVTVLESRTLQSRIIEWIGKHVGEFESMFLTELECGQLPIQESYFDLEGELWMNLDGDISPICLNILPLASSSLQSALSLKTLPANFHLLSVIERLANQGSLEGIDALLGCPLHLPSSKYFSGPAWRSLNGKQKQIVCLSVYYAANWIRELLNAFCTQVVKSQPTSQASKDEVIVKLLKRLRNLVFLECLLSRVLKQCPLSLPELHLHVEHSESSFPNQLYCFGPIEKGNDHKKTLERTSLNKKRKHIKNSKASVNSGLNVKFRQPTILHLLRKAGTTVSQDIPNGDSAVLSSNKMTSESSVSHTCDTREAVTIDASIEKIVDAQRFKFRPMLVYCLTILTFSKKEDLCCLDPAAELPLHLYLLRDLHHKLEFFAPCKQFPARCLSAPSGLRKMTVNEFLDKIRLLFPSLAKHLNSAVHILKEGPEACQEHWVVQSASSGNPNIPEIVVSKSLVASSVCKEILWCFSKMLNIPDFLMNKTVLLGLLEAFQPTMVWDSIFSGVQPIPTPGSIGYLYCGAYSFFEGILDLASSFSFTLASELLLTLESLVTSGQKFLEKSPEVTLKNMHTGFTPEVLLMLRNRLGTSAHKLLRHNCNNDTFKDGLKSRVEVQKILHIYLKYSESTSDLLGELACSILPQVPSCKAGEDEYHGFPSLCSATFIIWYRILVKEIVLNKFRVDVDQTSERFLIKLQQCVNVVVALVNMCKAHDKVAVHAMAVKYGGKFVDSFLKVFDFLQTHFQRHHKLVIQLVKELQKATRTVQSLCSEAKGLRKTVITRKIPATKRSLERFLFGVKTLLHTTSSGCTFWMGNLKHKDLMGQVVSSQAYGDDQNENIDDDPEEAAVEDQPIRVASEEER
ncbi:uncharacterized protein LOC131149872 isoform X2 [Malania oleifera]|uniref:uncharacterized protein LOC131149872 isoform X2 n=1 Tax=Malania oleifera TaxID=397392 RepID=UPI0025AE860D|nr:uncharacterized protein LOC131149872 isoform X2 [Malania oleifera]